MRILVIGAGPAGLTVAERLRELGRDDEIVMLSGEPYPPYAPPAMVDAFLTGRRASLFWRGEDVCERLGVDFRPATRATAVHPADHEVVLTSDEVLEYDRLVVASGSRLYAPIPGRDLPGVYDFKSLTAADALVASVRSGRVRRVVIVGAGFIGVEVALLLADLEVSVTMIEMTDRVMGRMLDAETAELVLAELRRRGVRVRLGTRAQGFAGRDGAAGVELDSGELLAADAAVAATGVEPNTTFLSGSGIAVDWGVLVDDHLRTSQPHVFAAGDVAATFDRMTGERYVHAIFPNAVAQGRIVAENLAGLDRRYEGAETMNSLKHLGLPVMAVGRAEGSVVLRERRGEYLRKIFLEDGRIVGFRLVGDVSGAGGLHSLMVRRVDVSSFGDRLLDPRFGVADLVAATGVLH